MMPRSQTSSFRLNHSGIAVLQHICRYRVATNASVQADVLVHLSSNAVTKITASLVRKRFLNRYPLAPPLYYFTLGPQAVRYFGLSRRRQQPLGPQALPANLGALYFCVHDQVRRQRLTPQELLYAYPWMPAAQRDGAFYFDTDDEGATRLALIRTDTGASADYLARRCAHDLAKRRAAAPEFAQLIASGGFLVAFVVPTKEKAEALAKALYDRSWPIKFRIAICSELLLLLARLPYGT